MRHAFALVLLTLTLTLAGAGAVSAAPRLVFEDGRRVPVPSVRSVDARLAFRIKSSEGAFKSVRVGPPDVRGPDQSPRATDCLRLETPELQDVGTSGAHVILIPDRERLAQHGDYGVEVPMQALATGTTTPTTATLVFTLVRAPAQLGVDDVRDTTYQLSRGYPWGAASAQLEVPLTESDIADIGQPELSVIGIRTSANKVQLPARVRASMLDLRASANAIAKGEQAIAVITVSGLDQCGTHTTTLRVASPSLVQAVSIPLKLSVADGPAIPFLVIAVGVLLAAGLNNLARLQGIPQRNVLRRLRLGTEIRQRTIPGASPELLVIQSLLQAADELDRTGDHKAAATKLDEVETKLAALKTAEQQARDALNKRLDVVEDRVTALLKAAPEPDLLNRLIAISTQLRDVKAAQIENPTGAAEKMQLAEEALLEVTKEMTARGIVGGGAAPATAATIRGGTDLLQATPAPEPALMNMAKRAREDAADPRELLEILRGALATRRGGTDALGTPARPAARLEAALEMMSEPVPHLVVRGDPTSWTTDATLLFEVVGIPPSWGPNLQYDWRFGDGTSDEDDVPSIAHRYDSPDSRTVVVTVYDRATRKVLKSLSCEVQVVESPADRERAKVLARVMWQQRGLIAAVAVLATITGMTQLYVDQPFGTLGDYLKAFLWGMAADTSVRGFVGVMGKAQLGPGA